MYVHVAQFVISPPLAFGCSFSIRVQSNSVLRRLPGLWLPHATGRVNLWVHAVTSRAHLQLRSSNFPPTTTYNTVARSNGTTAVLRRTLTYTPYCSQVSVQLTPARRNAVPLGTSILSSIQLLHQSITTKYMHPHLPTRHPESSGI